MPQAAKGLFYGLEQRSMGPGLVFHSPRRRIYMKTVKRVPGTQVAYIDSRKKGRKGMMWLVNVPQLVKQSYYLAAMRANDNCFIVGWYLP